ELADLAKEKAELEHLLATPDVMQKLIIKEIEADKKKFADPRRTLIVEAERASLEVTVVDEPVTIILSEKGWMRARQGHALDLQNLSFKDGDTLLAFIECRSIDPIAMFGTDGRVYSIQASIIPGGRGDGAPVTTLVDLAPKSQITQLLAAKPQDHVVIANSNGYGFYCLFENLMSRQKAGKSFLTLEEGETLLKVSTFVPRETSHVACLSQNSKLHIFTFSEFKQLTGGGRGVITMAFDDKDSLAAITVCDGLTLKISGTGRAGKAIDWVLNTNEIAAYLGKRARKGKPIHAGLKMPRF
ncbi:MAG: DNA topoisomerase IV subunit A, partial [Burkholderiales bacterium]|nr:DNA topoisomerase IV subunit A [Burkholderiales bacterium]